MKTVIKVCDMITSKDVNNIKSAISNNEGVIACAIYLEKKEVEIVFDNYFITVEDLIASIEDVGYTVV